MTMHDEAAPTFCGKRADQGRIVIGPEHPNEGYAVIRCDSMTAGRDGSASGRASGQPHGALVRAQRRHG